MLDKWTKHTPYYLQQTFVCMCIVLTAFISHIPPVKNAFFAEWGTFFLIGLMIPVSCYLYNRLFSRKVSDNSSMIILSWMTFGCLLTIIGKATKFLLKTYPPLVGLWVISFILLTSCWIAKKVVSSKQDYLPNQIDRHILFGMSAILTTLSWCALFQLPNWGAYMDALTQYTLATILISVFCWVVVQKLTVDGFSTNATKKTPKTQQHFLLIIFCALALFLGFRADSLFLDGSFAYHWTYFVGPVEALRSHGWLLWDTPSQYGFLNILIASLLPTKSAWEAIYILQSILLVLTSAIIYQFLKSTTSIFRIAASLAIAMCALHFADPYLEGPSAYPSSSVMRFFWCYVLVWIIYRYWQSERISFKSFAGYGSLCWTLSVLWSAESAIYGSCIFLPALCISWLQTYLPHSSQNWQTAMKTLLKQRFFYLLTPFLVLFCVIVSVSIYYQIFLGHYPEWSSHFVYGLLYAKGFGSLALNIKGPVWILILLLAGLVTLLSTVILENPRSRTVVLLVSLISCLWGISSYFIGRAVPNNITAMLPLLVNILFIALQISAQRKPQNATVILQAFAPPFLFIILFTVVGNPGIFSQLSTLSSFSLHIDEKVPRANFEMELSNLIKEAKIGAHDAIAYSGNLGLMPYVAQSPSHERLWLPGPLQLLEVPVPPERQAEIIQRSIERGRPLNKYLVHAKKEVEDRYENWIDSLQNYFIKTATFESEHWIIIKYQEKI